MKLYYGTNKNDTYATARAKGSRWQQTTVEVKLFSELKVNYSKGEIRIQKDTKLLWKWKILSYKEANYGIWNTEYAPKSKPRSTTCV